MKQLGHRSGNWLSLSQSSEVLNQTYGDGLRAKRDYAMLAIGVSPIVRGNLKWWRYPTTVPSLRQQLLSQVSAALGDGTEDRTDVLSREVSDC